jgi:hypothetical protein
MAPKSALFLQLYLPKLALALGHISLMQLSSWTSIRQLHGDGELAELDALILKHL